MAAKVKFDQAKGDVLTNWDASAQAGYLSTLAYTVSATTGDHIITTYDGADKITITGPSGTNTVRAGSGKNSIDLSKTTGSNEIYAGSGDDAVKAGSGADTIELDDGKNTVTDAGGENSITTGTGDDKITVAATSGGQTVVAGAGKNSVDLSKTTGTNSITAGLGDDAIKGGSGADTIDADAGNNTITDAGGENAITTGTGDDKITVAATSGAQTVEAGAGKNSVDLSKTTGTNSITAGLGDDAIKGGSGADTIDAGAGNNTITDAGGENAITTGTGDDKITVAVTSGAQTVVAGAGKNSVDLSKTTGTNSITAGLGDDAIKGGSGADTIDADAGNNTITDAGGANDITTGGGDDKITISATSAAQTIHAGDGKNTVDVSKTSGANEITTGSGVDAIKGGSGADTIIAGAGADVITGGAGADWISGGAGLDMLTGGLGADTFSLNSDSADDADSIKDFTVADDKIEFDISTDFSALRFKAGVLLTEQFYAASGASAGHDGDDRVVFDTGSGKLYYDADGNGSGAAALIATLKKGLVLTNNHFVLAADEDAPSTPVVALTSDTAGSGTTGTANDLITSNGTLNVTGTETGAFVEYSADDETWSSTAPTLAAGSNTVYVRQVDMAGNASSSTSITFTYDTTAAAPTVALATDSGDSGDKITNNGSLSVTGTETGAKIEYSANGTSGWTTVVPTPAAGSNTVYVRQTDKAGNVSGASEALTFTYDADAPSTPVVPVVSAAGLDGTISQQEALDGFDVTITLPEGVGAGELLELLVSGEVLDSRVLTAEDITAGEYAFVGIKGGDLGEDGAKAITARMTDIAGNVGEESTALDLVLSSSDPEVVSVERQTPSSISTGANALVFRVTFSEAIENIDTSDFVVSGTTATVTNVALVEGVNHTYDVTVSGGDLSSLNATVYLGFAGDQDITDSSGGALIPGGKTAYYVVDNTAPTAPSSAPTTTAGSSITAAENTAGVSVAVTLAGSGAVAGDTLELLLGGTAFTLAKTHVLTSGEITAGTYSFTLSNTDLGSDGSKSITAKITDAAGNVGTASSALVVTLDKTAPTVSSVAVFNPSSSTTASDSLVYRVGFSESVSNVSTDDFAITAASGTVTTATVAAVESAGTSNGVTYYDVTVSGGNLASYNGTVLLGLASGNNISDSAGNTLTASSTKATYTVDNTAPSAPSSAPTTAAGAYISSAESSAGFTVAASLAGSGAVAGDSIALKLGGSTTLATHTLTSGDITAGSVNLSVGASALGSDGSKSLTVVVTDVAGNVGTASSALAVTLDTSVPNAPSAPTTTAGGTISLGEANAGVSVAVSTSGTGAATGDTVQLLLGGGVLQTHTLTSGEISGGSYTFTVSKSELGEDGSKSFTAKIIDAAGNVGSASSALSVTLDTGVKTLAYSDTTFVESTENDGSVSTTIELTLAGETFTGTNDTALTGVSVTNLPSGLTASVVRTSSTTAEFTLSGTAGAHGNSADVSNVTLTFANGAFTGNSASSVTGSSQTFVINFADSGQIFVGNSGDNVLTGTSASNIIYGEGGADVISALGGYDTIDITDTGTTLASSATVLVTDEANGLDTVLGFKGGLLSLGGDVLDLHGIANLTDSVTTGQTLTTDFSAHNLYLFSATPVSIGDAASALAADTNVDATEGFIVIADSSRDGQVTVYHSTDLSGNGTETALVVLVGTTIGSLVSENFSV